MIMVKICHDFICKPYKQLNIQPCIEIGNFLSELKKKRKKGDK